IEFQLFWSLAQKAGCVVSRDDIHLDLYNAAYNGYDRNIDLYISRIRQKIGDDPSLPRYLKTVRGVGYMFVGG
ncbi:MAG: helix-turn-helix domain-containing protein, partial [Geopsychrobacter sp.]|nr:helix-turn-helix domain-containing protein [Geopsychrobacter sp.]